MAAPPFAVFERWGPHHSLSSSHAQLSWSLLINQESPCHCLFWSGYGQYRTGQRRCFALHDYFVWAAATTMSSYPCPRMMCRTPRIPQLLMWWLQE